ncbi:MAG: hypothetical protein BWX72_00046 [Firmicutes bacterium ADurb.Bin080]|nr:MAG: hypothetical protein BWX72_00046 [Firmicutes bacterium ADurb.Bin080]
MTKEETTLILNRIIDDYNALPEPKYRHADIDKLKNDYDLLMEMKPYQKENQRYENIINAISQTINRIVPKSNDWRTVSERGINKAIPPVIRKKNHTIEFPFQWTDDKSGCVCYINDYWGARNYMVMDIIGYYLLLKEGKDLLPKNAAPIFNNMKSIATRESVIAGNSSNSPVNKTIMNDQDIQRIQNTRYNIRFTDKDFRKNTSQNMSSNEIMNLLLETSRVEFKLVFPVRLWNGKKAKEQTYNMNFFSRLFEFGYVDKETRADGIVTLREYYISFNTVLGELFAHNLLSQSYDWLDNRFYNLPYNSQVFYRRFLLHNDYKNIPIKIETIRQRLNLDDKNVTNLKNTIERNVLTPLVNQGLIDSYEKEKDGLYGLKYIVKRKNKNNEEIKLQK